MKNNSDETNYEIHYKQKEYAKHRLLGIIFDCLLEDYILDKEGDANENA